VAELLSAPQLSSTGAEIKTAALHPSRNLRRVMLPTPNVFSVNFFPTPLNFFAAQKLPLLHQPSDHGRTHVNASIVSTRPAILTVAI
jgi:hypothetical protein